MNMKKVEVSLYMYELECIYKWRDRMNVILIQYAL